MSKKRNYEPSQKVFEAYYSLYSVGCYRRGQVVSLSKEIKNTEEFKGLNKELARKFEAMIDSQQAGESTICVAAVSLNNMVTQNYQPSTITLAYSLGGGRYQDEITVPGTLCDYIDVIGANGSNLVSTIPPTARVDHELKTYPKEVDMNELEAHRNDGTIRTDFSGDIK